MEDGFERTSAQFKIGYPLWSCEYETLMRLIRFDRSKTSISIHKVLFPSVTSTFFVGFHTCLDV